MELIKQSSAEFYQGDGYAGMDYPSSDQDINFAMIKISGRSPKTGFQLNESCKELLYIVSGEGTISWSETVEVTEFQKGDVIVIAQGEKYAFDGTFEAAVSCAPAWTSSQHKYVE